MAGPVRLSPEQSVAMLDDISKELLKYDLRKAAAGLMVGPKDAFLAATIIRERVLKFEQARRGQVQAAASGQEAINADAD